MTTFLWIYCGQKHGRRRTKWEIHTTTSQFTVLGRDILVFLRASCTSAINLVSASIKTQEYGRIPNIWISVGAAILSQDCTYFLISEMVAQRRKLSETIRIHYSSRKLTLLAMPLYGMHAFFIQDDFTSLRNSCPHGEISSTVQLPQFRWNVTQLFGRTTYLFVDSLRMPELVGSLALSVEVKHISVVLETLPLLKFALCT